MALHFIQAMQNAMFQQNNVRPHIARIGWIFLDTKYAWPLLLLTRFTVLSRIEKTSGQWLPNECLVTIIITVDERRHLAKSNWEAVHIPSNHYTIQCPGL